MHFNDPWSNGNRYEFTCRYKMQNRIFGPQHKVLMSDLKPYSCAVHCAKATRTRKASEYFVKLPQPKSPPLEGCRGTRRGGFVAKFFELITFCSLRNYVVFGSKGSVPFLERWNPEKSESDKNSSWSSALIRTLGSFTTLMPDDLKPWNCQG